MKKLFISQPMNGKSDEEILAERDEAIEKAKSLISQRPMLHILHTDGARNVDARLSTNVQ